MTPDIIKEILKGREKIYEELKAQIDFKEGASKLIKEVSEKMPEYEITDITQFPRVDKRGRWHRYVEITYVTPDDHELKIEVEKLEGWYEKALKMIEEEVAGIEKLKGKIPE